MRLLACMALWIGVSAEEAGSSSARMTSSCESSLGRCCVPSSSTEDVLRACACAKAAEALVAASAQQKRNPTKRIQVSSNRLTSLAAKGGKEKLKYLLVLDVHKGW